MICPIGDEGGDIRKRSDLVLKFIIEPVASEKFKYKVLRSDAISVPGLITSQIVEHLINDELVVADLSEGNPNVFYELAIRHLVRKPVLHLIRSGGSIPFDLKDNRAIQFELDLQGVDECKKQLAAQIEAVHEDPENACRSPISTVLDLEALARTQNPLKEMMGIVIELRDRVHELTRMTQEREVGSRPASGSETLTISASPGSSKVFTRLTEFFAAERKKPHCPNCNSSNVKVPRRSLGGKPYPPDSPARGTHCEVECEECKTHSQVHLSFAGDEQWLCPEECRSHQKSDAQ